MNGVVGLRAVLLLAALFPWHNKTNGLFCYAPVVPQEEPDKIHVKIYKKVAPATVFVRGGGQSGSGVVIDKSGIILTSPTACGVSTQTVTVVVPGAKQYRGKVLGRVNEKELVLVKIDAHDLPTVEFGDSDAVKVGQVSYVLGDSFQSIQSDGQPAMSLGVVSAIYDVTQKQRGTYYTGKVIETSAAVNPNQDGGPLVDRQGRLLGIVTLNYDESKFTGVAIPINELRKDIERIREGGGIAEEPPKKTGDAWLGAEIQGAADGVEVTRVVRNSPAARSGLRKGDIIVKLDGAEVSAESALKKTLEQKSAGDTVKVMVSRDGTTKELSVKLAKRPLY